MNIANKLTVLRVVLVPVFVAIFLIQSIPYNTIIATVIFAIASLTDLLDGYLARKLNLITDFGKFLDPIADKILVNAAAVLLVFVNFSMVENNQGNWIGLVVLVVCLIYISREMIVSGFRLVASTKGTVLAADKLGKLKTITQMLGLLIVLPLCGFLDDSIVGYVLYCGLAVLIVSAIVSILSCVNYIVKNRSVLAGSM